MRLVLGKKIKDNEVLLTLCERKTLVIKIPEKTADSVMNTFKELRQGMVLNWTKFLSLSQLTMGQSLRRFAI